jgi:predicted ATPase
VVAAAPLLASLLMVCPQLKLLTSSRIAWRVRGEHVVYIGPLALPDTSLSLTWHAITQSPAVALFVERASAVRSDFKLTNENTTAVLELCTRLDGLPLAIELAASCMTVLSPNTLLEQLIAGRQPLRFLTCGPRDLPPRQQSLSAAIEWGYQLLQYQEQTLFRRLAVFVGGGTFEAIVAVCEGIENEPIPAETGQPQGTGVSLLSALSSLVDNNLVLQRTYPDGHVRFSMLQIIREYAYERLAGTGNSMRFQERYVRYYMNAVEAIAHQQASVEQALWLDYVERELDNILESLRWALDASRPDLALRIGGAIWRFWLIRGHIYEGYDWLERVLKCSDTETSSIRAEVHYGAGILALLRHDFSQALAHSSIYLALQQEEAQSEGIARAYTQLGLIAYWQGDFKTAFSILQQNSTLLNRFEDSDGKAEALQILALTLLAQQEHEVMSQWNVYHHEEHWRQRHTHRSAASVDWGELFLSMPVNEQVVAYLEQSLALYQQTQHTHGIAHTLSLLARVSLRTGDIVQSIEYLQPGIRLFWALRDRLGLATAFVTCAELMTVTQREEQGAYFLSVAASIYDAVGIAPSSIEWTRQDVLNRAIRARLSYPVWKTMWHRGRATALNHVVVEALNGMDIRTHTYRMYTMQEKQLGGNP